MSSIQFIVFYSCLLFMATHVNAQSNFDTSSSKSGGNTVLTVGTDIDCDHNTIQAAIDAAPVMGSTEIRITHQQEWNERLRIINKSALTLKGRYNSCMQLGASHSVIKGGASTTSAPAILIVDSWQISLYGLDVRDAEFSGGIEINNSQVNINYVSIRNNKHRNLISGLTGGGLFINNNSDVGVFNSFIYANQAQRGGGIGCLGSQMVINNSEISSNLAINNSDTGVGGGIYTSGGCLLEMNNFDNSITYNNSNTINNNSADYRGGGLYATGGSQVLINNPNNPNFINNSAQTTGFLNNKILAEASLVESGGAGIAAVGSGTDITAFHLTLANNQLNSTTVDSGGGALFIKDQATFSMQIWQPGNSCDMDTTPDNRPNRMCNQIYNHTAFSGNKGGMAYLTDNAQADIYQTFITENMASAGHLAYIDNATLRMQGNIITQNGNTFFGGGELIYAQSGGSFIGDFNSFTNNRLGSALGDGFVIATSQAGFIHLTRSIIDEAAETDLFLNSIDTTSAFNCLLAHEDDSFFGTEITLGIPHFQVTWPYHLHQFSDGVDMCLSTGGSLPIENDIDGDVRGFCTGLSCVVNPQRFDAGADEYRNTDLIYKNGFD